MQLQYKVREMMEGALISGVFLVLMFLTIYTPLGIATAFALPVPFTVFAARNGWRKSILVIVVSSLLTLIIGAFPSVISALFAGGLGTVMGSIYYLKKPAYISFVGGTLINLCFFLLSIVVSYYLFALNPITTLQEMLKQSFETSQSIIGKFGAVDPKQTQMLTEMIDMMGKMIPMLLIVGAAQFALINHWLSRKVLTRLGTEIPAFPPFRQWKWPKSILYYYILIMFASILIGLYKVEGSIYLLLINVKPIFDIMMMIQGLSFLFFFTHEKGWGKMLPIMAIALIFIFQPFPLILSLLGIIDLGTNLRKRITSKS
jgi:uncharacterized protein YybS (DUF2232 family)